MKEILIKEINYSKNKKAKDNLKKIYNYIENLESIIYKIKECLILTDEELEIYKMINRKEEKDEKRRSL